LFTKEIEVTSKQFEGDQSKGISIFSGDVVVKRAKDYIKADKVIVTTDKKKKPTKLEFFGSNNHQIDFTINYENNISYKGKTDKIEYYPITREYILTGNVSVEGIVEKRKIYGEKIVLEQVNKKAKIFGTDNRPARFIFEVNE